MGDVAASRATVPTSGYGEYDQNSVLILCILEVAWQCGPSVLISLSLSLSLSLYNSTSELRLLKWLGMVLLHNSVPEVSVMRKHRHSFH